jgi:hypothetical protein
MIAVDGARSTWKRDAHSRDDGWCAARASGAGCTVRLDMRPERQEAVEGLVTLCRGASGRAPVHTSDSWLHFEGSEARDVIEALGQDRSIGKHLQTGNSLYLAGTNWGMGVTPVRHWLAGFLRAALAKPPTEWQAEAERFASLLGVDGGTVPCTVRTTLLGVLLDSEEPIELTNGTIRPARLSDFSRIDAHPQPPAAVVFEYEDEMPAAVSRERPTFAPETEAGVARAHEDMMTRLLLAFALATTGPAQVHLTMREVRYSGGGGGSEPEDVGPIVVAYPTVLDAASTERVVGEHARLAESSVRQVGIATRRYLLARSERGRPADRVIDYAIALESMAEERSGKAQGQELARLLASPGGDHGRVEREHIAFREARRRIVHDGETPADVKDAAALGEDLVRRSLRARTERG